MPTFTFDGPDGQSLTLEGPEGATKEQAFQELQNHLNMPKAPTWGAAAEDVGRAAAGSIPRGLLQVGTAPFTGAQKAAEFAGKQVENQIGPNRFSTGAATAAKAVPLTYGQVQPEVAKTLPFTDYAAKYPAGKITEAVGEAAPSFFPGPQMARRVVTPFPATAARNALADTLKTEAKLPVNAAERSGSRVAATILGKPDRTDKFAQALSDLQERDKAIKEPGDPIYALPPELGKDLRNQTSDYTSEIFPALGPKQRSPLGPAMDKFNAFEKAGGLSGTQYNWLRDQWGKNPETKQLVDTLDKGMTKVNPEFGRAARVEEAGKTIYGKSPEPYNPYHQGMVGGLVGGLGGLAATHDPTTGILASMLAGSATVPATWLARKAAGLTDPILRNQKWLPPVGGLKAEFTDPRNLAAALALQAPYATDKTKYYMGGQENSQAPQQ